MKEKIFISSERLKGISIKFSGKMWLMIILKVTKKQGFTLSLSLENTFLEKPPRGGDGGGAGGSNSPPRLFRFKSRARR